MVEASQARRDFSPDLPRNLGKPFARIPCDALLRAAEGAVDLFDRGQLRQCLEESEAWS